MPLNHKKTKEHLLRSDMFELLQMQRKFGIHMKGSFFEITHSNYSKMFILVRNNKKKICSSGGSSRFLTYLMKEKKILLRYILTFTT